MSRDAKSGTESEEKKSKAIIILVVALVAVILALVGVIAYWAGRNSGNNNGEALANRDPVVQTREEANSSRIILDEESAQSVIDQMREEVEEGMFECSMSTDWSFKDGNAESKDAYVANSKNNRHPFYFDVVLKDSEELIYSSPLLPVGSELTNFKLSTALPAGKYKALCKYTLVQDEQNQEPISAANFVVNITIEN